MSSKDVLLQMKYARIISLFAEETGITRDEALDFFYGSDLYVLLNKQTGGLYAEGDGYIVELLEEEAEKKKSKE